MVINFSKPTAELRRRAVHETWHADIVAALDVEQVVVDTAGCSFAELAEAKKLLVMHFAEVDRWDWPWALGPGPCACCANAAPSRTSARRSVFPKRSRHRRK